MRAIASPVRYKSQTYVWFTLPLRRRREGNGTTMKRLASILALQLCMTALAMGQMPGMASHPDSSPDNSSASTTTQSSPKATFSKDVAPILQQHCQTCHRPGEGAPFSMLTYEDARPWARAMKKMVQQREMPPWFE